MIVSRDISKIPTGTIHTNQVTQNRYSALISETNVPGQHHQLGATKTEAHNK